MPKDRINLKVPRFNMKLSRNPCFCIVEKKTPINRKWVLIKELINFPNEKLYEIRRRKKEKSFV